MIKFVLVFHQYKAISVGRYYEGIKTKKKSSINRQTINNAIIITGGS